MAQKSSTPLVSIIIPVYNAEKYLRECLDSIINQTLKNIEIICVNDGSTDNSLNIIKEYTRKDARIKIVNKKNGGIASARVAGYSEASGEYIGWVDSDDFVAPNMYKKMITTAQKENADMVYCNYNFYPKKTTKKQKWYKPHNGSKTWKIVLNNTQEWNKIVKKSLLDTLDIPYLFERIGEGCYGLVIIKSNSIVSIDECLYNYRVGHTSLSNNYSNTKWYQFVVEKAKNNLEYVKEKHYEKEWIDYYTYRYLYYNLILALIAARNNNKNEYRKAIENTRNERLFSKKYIKFLKENTTLSERMFLYYSVHAHFTTTKFISRIILR